MSDFDNFSKTIQKKFFRTKEKVLVSLGKADKTKDGDFDSLANTFHEQHATANKLLKTFRNYSAQVKAMSLASKNMHQAVSDAYEPNWGGAEDFAVQTEQLNKLWDDHFVKVSETIQFHIMSYVSKFPEFKNKIAKRGRKLVDYDRARHKLDALEKSKKRDEYKITTATRELNAAQTIYETINNELFEELPVLYNSRIPLLSNYFSLFLRTESSFEEELTKIKRQMADLTAGLLKEQNIIASNAVVGALRAKTLPRREPPKMAATSDKKGRYSPQLDVRGIQVRNMNKGATLPPKPPSPKFSPYGRQPPPPQEPAPLPPPVSSASPVYSTIGQTKNQTSASSPQSPPPQNPPPPHFGFYSPPHKAVHANQSSSSPPPVPPPPSCISANEFSPPSSSPPMSSPSSPPPPPSSPPHHFQVNTENLISYVPQLIPLAGHVHAVEPSNPFEADLKVEAGKVQSDLSKETSKVVTNISQGMTDIGKKMEESAVECGKEIKDGGCKLAVKVENAVNSAMEKVTTSGGVEVTSGDKNPKVESQVLAPGQKPSRKVDNVLNNASKVVEDAVEKAKVNVSEVGKTITENIGIVAGKVTTAANAAVDGVAKNVGNADAKVEGHSCEIILPSNRYLHKVQATHNYTAADSDEMSLMMSDVIYVLPIDSKEFEDEGWALGLKQKDGSRGMFPVNFTRKMD